MPADYPRIYADFHNADAKGRLRLNCIGTIEDLSRQKVQLNPGLRLTLYSDDADELGNPQELQVAGSVEYSSEEQCWVASIDWSAIQSVPVIDDDGKDVPNATHTRMP